MAQPVVLEGKYEAKGLRLGIIVARFNEKITEALLQGALYECQRLGCATQDIHVFRVPGAFEIPVMARNLSQRKQYDALICLGAVIKGKTSHYEYRAKNRQKFHPGQWPSSDRILPARERASAWQILAIYVDRLAP